MTNPTYQSSNIYSYEPLPPQSRNNNPSPRAPPLFRRGSNELSTHKDCKISILDNLEKNNYIKNIFSINDLNHITNICINEKNNNNLNIQFLANTIIKVLSKKFLKIQSEYDKLKKEHYDLMIKKNLNHDESLDKCCICLENDKDHAYINCGHMCVCKDCLIGDWIDKCPICKTYGECIKIFK